MQVRDKVEVIRQNYEAILHSLDQLKIDKKDKVEKATESLFWLLRGWQSEDYDQRYIAFFTALEFIIPDHQQISSDAFFETRQKLLRLITDSAQFDGLNLDLFLFREPPAVSLSVRFERFAINAKLDEWERDILKFREYHKLRNALLHRGDSKMAQSHYVENEVLIQFELFVQKYVRYIL